MIIPNFILIHTYNKINNKKISIKQNLKQRFNKHIG